MQPAVPATVLGDFTGARLEHFGVVTTFSRAEDKFLVRTDGPDRALHEYEIAYTFGVYPLQQYLIAMPGGRLQALGIAWDSRPQEQGGQRWFHLNPDQALPAGDRTHWTGRDQTWNYMCANCHSTGLRKDYDLSENSFATSWTDVNVGCEACHGPGSAHIAWAQGRGAAARASPPATAAGSAADDHMGLAAWLRAVDNGRWAMNPATGIAKRTEPLVSAELDVCAACHARRKVIAELPQPGGPFLESYMPTLLEPGLYHADGQIDGEVFEYGSFLQSRMHQAGVTCSNCHEPHGLKLRAEGNNLCGQCHLPAKFDVAEHYHHQPGSAGAQCVNCHMATKTYMGVDERRDHSFRVPRPDLTAATGSPNSCNQCHANQTSEWAAGAVAEWFPNGRHTASHYGTALEAGRTGAPDATRQLEQLIRDPAQPAIARASALLLLPDKAGPAFLAIITAAVADPDPLVRMGAARALPAMSSPALVAAAAPLLSDPLRAVRIEAARALAGVEAQAMTPDQRAALAKSRAELVAAELVDAERPEAHLNLGLLAVREREPTQAEVEYATALRLDADFVPALVNLADLDRMRGMDQQGALLLRKAAAIEPDNAAIRHALGLLLVRQRNYAEALPLLRAASELAPGNVRYAYVYGVALNSTGAPVEAMAWLEQAHRQQPADTDLLVALISIARDSGDSPAAFRHAQELAILHPEDPRLRALVRELDTGRTH